MGAVSLTASGSEAKTVFTPDLQASVLFRKDALSPRQAETTVQVRLIPINPETIAPPPPGARFDSNAYRTRRCTRIRDNRPPCGRRYFW